MLTMIYLIRFLQDEKHEGGHGYGAQQQHYAVDDTSSMTKTQDTMPREEEEEEVGGQQERSGHVEMEHRSADGLGSSAGAHGGEDTARAAEETLDAERSAEAEGGVVQEQASSEHRPSKLDQGPSMEVILSERGWEGREEEGGRQGGVGRGGEESR